MMKFKKYGRPITSQAIEAFRLDLFAELEVDESQDMNELFQRAWKYGHEFGLEEVYYHFVDLVGIFTHTENSF
jgi:hypothetical protein